jgi:probable F420-dependent oxidoreductase
MKFGLMYSNIGVAVQPDGAAAIASQAEALGFDSLWTVEHVVVPAAYQSTYPYRDDGRLPGGPDAPIPDPLIWLSWVAARTERILLATGMLILPQRSPVVLAKELATLDVLSAGRAILGAGLGWLREEFAAIGVPFERRGRRLEEAIAAMRVLWAENRPTFAGEFFRFEDARMWPKPVRRCIPVVLGGHTEVAARRAGRIADGYFPGRSHPEQLAPLLAALRAAAEEAGRDPSTIEITVGTRPDPAAVDALRRLGVDRVVVAPRGADLPGVVGAMETAASTLREAVGTQR